MKSDKRITAIIDAKFIDEDSEEETVVNVLTQMHLDPVATTAIQVKLAKAALELAEEQHALAVAQAD